MNETSSRETCPECGRPVDPTIQQLCPYCRYPLVLSRRPESEPAVELREPGQETTRPQPVVEAAAAPAAQYCPACGAGNVASRVRCAVCGHALGEVARPITLPPPDSAPTSQVLHDRWPAVVAVLGVLTVVFLVAWLFTRGDDGDTTPQPSGPGGPRTGDLVELPAADVVRVQSTSHAPDSGGRTFLACHVLDGNPATLWRSGPASEAPGSALSFWFARPTHVLGLTISNGDSSSDAAYRQSSAATTYAAITDAGTQTLTVKDSPGPQRLVADLGTTSTLVLRAVTVRAGTVAPALAVSDVGFLTARGSTTSAANAPGVSCPPA